MQLHGKMGTFGLLMLVAFQPSVFARLIPSHGEGLANVANGVDAALLSEKFGGLGTSPYPPRSFEGVQGGSKLPGDYWMKGQQDSYPEMSVVQINGESVRAREEHYWAPCPPGTPPGNFCYKTRGDDNYSPRYFVVQGVERKDHVEGHYWAPCPPGTPKGNFCYASSGEENYLPRDLVAQGVERKDPVEGHYWAPCPPGSPQGNFCYGSREEENILPRDLVAQGVERKDHVEGHYWAPCPSGTQGKFSYNSDQDEDHSPREPKTQGVKRDLPLKGHW